MLWTHARASIREIQESFPIPRPAYTTIQTTVYRLEAKKAVRRVKKIGNADTLEITVAREVTRHRLLDEISSYFGGRAQPMMAQLAEAGKLTLAAMYANWRRPSSEYRVKNDRSPYGPRLAIDRFCRRCCTGDTGLAQKRRTCSTRSLVLRLCEVPVALFLADRRRQPDRLAFQHAAGPIARGRNRPWCR